MASGGTLPFCHRWGSGSIQYRTCTGRGPIFARGFTLANGRKLPRDESFKEVKSLAPQSNQSQYVSSVSLCPAAPNGITGATLHLCGAWWERQDSGGSALKPKYFKLGAGYSVEVLKDLFLDPNISGPEWQVLKALIGWAKPNRTANPTYDQIAFHGAIARRQIARHVRSLEIKGYIRVEKSAWQGKPRVVYHFTDQCAIRPKHGGGLGRETPSLQKILKTPHSTESPKIVTMQSKPAVGWYPADEPPDIVSEEGTPPY